MRVLWFANTPCNADEYFNSELKGTGGWLKALDQNISTKVDLHVAFYHHEVIETFEHNNVTYYPIPTGTNNKLKRYIHRLIGKVIFDDDVNLYLNIINQVKPDIIHIHGTENPFAYLISKTRVPCITSIQGNITVYHHKYFSGILKSEAYIAKDFKNKLIANTPFRLNFLKFGHMAVREQEMMKNCRHIMGRTFWDKSICRILSPQAQYYLGDEILRGQFYNHKWESRTSEMKTVFTTNGNSVYKGFETLCYALNLLNEDPDHMIRWKVAGISETDEIVIATKRQLGTNYPKNNLILLGGINENELVDELLSADLYVMPSHIENSPNSLCEALLLGLPSIATFVGGTGSLINHNVDGTLIQDGDPFVMAGMVKLMLENRDIASKMGEMARKRAIIRHDKQRIVSDLIKSYTEIIKRNV